MKSPVKTFTIYAILFVCSVVVIPYFIVQKRINDNSPEKTTSILNRYYRTKLRTYVKKLSLVEGRVHLLTNGQFDFKGNKPSEIVIINPATDSFSFGTDKATTVQFMVKQIEDDGILFEYEYIRDYRPFGKDFVMRNKGLVKLKWTKNS